MKTWDYNEAGDLIHNCIHLEATYIQYGYGNPLEKVFLVRRTRKNYTVSCKYCHNKVSRELLSFLTLTSKLTGREGNFTTIFFGKNKQHEEIR